MLRTRLSLAAAAAILLGCSATAFAQDGKPKDKPMKEENVQMPEDVDVSTGTITPGQARGRGERGDGDAERRGGRGEEVKWAELPKPVLDAFSKVFVHGNPATATRIKLGRQATFEARESDTAEMVFARATEDGTLLEVGRKAKSVPAAVQSFIDERLGGKVGTVREVSTTYYEIEVLRGANARVQRMNVNAAGQPVPGTGLAQMMDRGAGPRNGGEKPPAAAPPTGKPKESSNEVPTRPSKPTSGDKPKPKDAPKGQGLEKPKGPK